MKKFSLALLLVHITALSIAQVGIGTTLPQETLHIAGTARIDVTNQPSVFTTKLFGLNEDGTLREINVGTNLILVNNFLSATVSGGSAFDHSFGSIDLPEEDQHDNVDLLIGAGQFNDGKTIIRINITGDPTKDVEITGFEEGFDGQHIWIYAQAGGVTLKTQDTDSQQKHRIEINDKTGAKEWEMIELVYDLDKRGG